MQQNPGEIMYSTTFEKSILFILRWEGGYVNDPDDPGDETKYGISKRANPNLDIKNLTIEQAKEIYYRDYWLKAHCDKLESISARLAFIQFNTAVNAGIRRANITLQKSINRQLPIVVDGIVGPKTLKALKRINADLCFDTYCMMLTSFYTHLVNKRINLRKFFRGWMNRVVDAYEYGLNEF